MSATLPLQHVLVTTDLSPAAEPALIAAACVARALSARVTLLHVLDAGSLAGAFPMRSRAERLKSEWRQQVAPRLELLAKRFLDPHAYEVALIEAPAVAEGICGFASDNQADIVVIATNGRTGVRRWLMGSVAERVLQKAPGSVLVVRSDIHLDPRAGIERILVPIDFSECAALALEEAVEIARHHGAELDLLHSYEILVPLGLRAAPSQPAAVSLEGQRARLVAQRLEDVKVKVGAHGVRAQTFLSPEPRVRAILDTAARRRPDLIVMGTHLRSGMQRLLAGSTVDPVVRRSPCPVLTVRAPDPGRERSAADRSEPCSEIPTRSRRP